MKMDPEDVAGLYTERVGYLDELLVCTKCMTDEEWENRTGDSIVSREECEDTDYYCDVCHKLLPVE